jgi:hypothetical protein
MATAWSDNAHSVNLAQTALMLPIGGIHPERRAEDIMHIHRRPSAVLQTAVLCLVVAACPSCSKESVLSPTTPASPTAFTVAKVLVEVPPHAPSWTSNGPCPTGIGLNVWVIGPNDQAQSHAYTYQWERSDGSVVGTLTRTVDVSTAAPPFADNYSYFVSIPRSESGWVQLHVLSPNDITSSRVTWTVTCPAS